MKRPDCIRHWRDVEGADDSTYSDSHERFSIGAPLARKLGLGRIGIHHERLPPGRRTSYPHAESDEEEFIYVLEGYPRPGLTVICGNSNLVTAWVFLPERVSATPSLTTLMKRCACWSLGRPIKSTTASTIR